MQALHSRPLPIAPGLRRLALIAGAATALALLTTAQEGVALVYAGESAPWAGLLKARLVDWYACALFMPVLFLLARRYPVRGGEWQHHLPILLLAAVPIAIAKEAIFVAVGEFFRPGVFDLATILSEDLSYEIMVVWALLAVAHLVLPAAREVAPAQSTDTPDAIEVGTRHGSDHVRLDEIEFVDAQGNYARLVTARGRFLVRETMARMEGRLGAEFIRVHRSVIVRRDRVARVEARAAGGGWIQLVSGQRLRVGRSYRPKVQALSP